MTSIGGVQMQTEMVRTKDQLVDASKNIALTESELYPLRFKPIYQYRPWGGRRLADLLTEPMPSGPVGAMCLPRVLVCIESGGEIEQGYATYTVGKGEVLFLPAVVGTCTVWPRGAVTLLEISLPE